MSTKNKFHVFSSIFVLFGMGLLVLMLSGIMAGTALAAYPTPTRTRTPVPGATLTRTPTRANGPTFTPTSVPPTPTWTPTVVGAPTPVVGADGSCSPVSGDIAADPTKTVEFFVHGTFCWRSTNLGSAINSFSTLQLLINGANFTNIWAPTTSLPPKIKGYWYVFFQSSVLNGDFMIFP